MRTHPLASVAHAAAFGLLFACLGFSIALATCESRGLNGAEMRSISTNFTRPPAVFVTDSDLGVVVAGTQFTRQIVVRLGFKPHRFFFGVAKPSSGVTITESGELGGAVDSPGTQAFEVRVEDQVNGSATVSTTKVFSLTAIESLQAPQLALMFVNAPELPVAVANEPYSFTFHANGGNPPYVFQFASDDDFMALPLGLSLNTENGEIMGKPIAPTPNGDPVSFTIICTDSLGTVVTRTFSLLVLPGTISSEIVATTGKMVLMFGKEKPSDSLRLTMLLNKTDLARNGIRDNADLRDMTFAMDFGGVSLPPALTNDGSTTADAATKFDKNGQIRFPNVMQNLLPAKGENLQYEIKLNARTGQLKAKFLNIDMIKRLGANFTSFIRRTVIPVNIRISVPATATGAGTGTSQPGEEASAGFDKTDVVKFAYVRRGAVGSGSALANTKAAPAGIFLVTKVQGVERQVDVNTDRLFLKMAGLIRQVNNQPLEFGTDDRVAVLFGDVALGVFPASSLRQTNGRLEFVNEDRSAGLHAFIVDQNKGTFFIDTHGLDPRALFGTDIPIAGEPLVMPVTLTIGADGAIPLFDGQSSVTLFRRGNTIKNK